MGDAIEGIVYTQGRAHRPVGCSRSGTERRPVPRSMSHPSSARTPREVADAIELWNCPPLRARISEAQCERNHATARSTKGVNPLEACLTCPGVRALAKGSGPVERVARDAPIADEAADARGRRRGQNKRISPFVGRLMKPPGPKSDAIQMREIRERTGLTNAKSELPAAEQGTSGRFDGM